jgi:cellulose synthase/poly-beta-1,6-N-acetylglucosamine synthase-like glycosyltransferase
LGLSAALIGSGMAFDYKWFKENVKKLKTAGEDKELESLLLKQKIFIDYLNNVFVYDEKTKKADAFSRQRRRWLASQLGSLKTGLKDLPGALWTMNIDYVDKIIQWMLLPRVMVLGIISIATVITSIFSFGLSVKWWLLLIGLSLTFVIAAPDFITHKNNLKAIRKVPLIFLLMVFNLFRLKGVNRKFIHTDNN